MLLNEITEQQPEVVVLVGLPGSGKSTYIAQLKKNKAYHVASTDDIFEELAKKAGVTYTEAFNSNSYKEVEQKMIIGLKQAVNKSQNIIIDQTNMSAKARARKLGYIPKEYKKIAVVFNVDPVELQRRLEQREQETGKHIPPFVVKSMRESYQEPTKSEGFNEIKHV